MTMSERTCCWSVQVRGPLLYSLPIAHDYIVYDHHFGHGDAASEDLFLVPSKDNGAKWNYALAVDPENLTNGALQFERDSRRKGGGSDAGGAGWLPGTAPFNRTGQLSIKVKARRLPSWQVFANSAAPPPRSPACGTTRSRPSTTDTKASSGTFESSGSSGADWGDGVCGALETIELVPHGFTELRIGEFPLA
jgi:hypothetical protein